MSKTIIPPATKRAGTLRSEQCPQRAEKSRQKWQESDARNKKRVSACERH